MQGALRLVRGVCSAVLDGVAALRRSAWRVECVRLPRAVPSLTCAYHVLTLLTETPSDLRIFSE